MLVLHALQRARCRLSGGLMEMSFFLRARRRMACGFVFALALSGPVVAAPPAIPISYTEALQRAVANAPT
ncbi:hypothetical protein L2216_27180, partial [Xanthomonas perforans]|nr:hypothetical protein [Xanthomonas perforans]